MADSFVFSMESTPNFSFNLYENVPVGEHTAIIKDIIVEKDKPTAYGELPQFVRTVQKPPLW